MHEAGEKMTTNPFILMNQGSDKEFICIHPYAVEMLGIPGRMTYRSKSLGKPSSIFNANIFDEKAMKIWFGDLEIERDREKLLSIADKIGTLYVLNESDGRFLKSLPKPGYIKSVAIIIITSDKILYDEQWARAVVYFEKKTLKLDYEEQIRKLQEKISRMRKKLT
jgi:hypothetical protein